MLLEYLIQFLSLLVVEVKVLALGDSFGAHHLGNGGPVSAILEQTCGVTAREEACSHYRSQKTGNRAMSACVIAAVISTHERQCCCMHDARGHTKCFSGLLSIVLTQTVKKDNRKWWGKGRGLRNNASCNAKLWVINRLLVGQTVAMPNKHVWLVSSHCC